MIKGLVARMGTGAERQSVGDPKNWDCDLHSKLSFMAGWVQSQVGRECCEYPNVNRDSDEQLVDAILRMMFRAHGDVILPG